MHARFYSPHLGRFMSTDPVGGATRVPQSWNRYAYTLGNPIKFTDPQGLFPYFPLGDLPVATIEDEITVTGDFLPVGFVNFLGFGSLLRNLGRLNSLPHLPGSMCGLKFKEALSTAVAAGDGGDCTADPNCVMLAEVTSNRAHFDALEIGVSNIAGGYVFGAGFSLFGNVARSSFGLFGTGSKVGRLGYTLSGHAAEQMAARGVSESAVSFARLTSTITSQTLGAGVRLRSSMATKSSRPCSVLV